jgi:hypothetical protein
MSKNHYYLTQEQRDRKNYLRRLRRSQKKNKQMLKVKHGEMQTQKNIKSLAKKAIKNTKWLEIQKAKTGEKKIQKK